MKRYIFALINGISLVLFSFDRIFKHIIIENPEFFQGFSSFLLSFQLYKNTGIAFSLNLPLIIIILFTLPILFILVYYIIHFFEKKKYWEYFFVSFIILGAVSNLLDRITYGFVIDYIQTPLYWWVFNIADIMITVGVSGLIFSKSEKK